ncbi:hypothetical protein [Aeromonas sp. sif2416]|uniref:hypothetical protein n=1 Tax=Aeromonas sp. sif2416 TaxID=2854793 RepID=UPI001C463BA6|nr:hypothetical protein [Aeromonas sp. sif2416]MBV7437072.1 hypothetical protein [Aeromonas sp. sif2416]
MNNHVDTTIHMPALLTLSANTEALFQTWMTQALVSLAISPEVLMQGQTALVTLAGHGHCESETQAPAAVLANLPNTTCTLTWQCGRWIVSSFSSLTLIEEHHPPCTEHVFWFGQHAESYRVQWAAMRHEEAVMALQEWELQLHASPHLAIQVSLQMDHQEHDITLYPCAEPDGNVEMT